MYKSLREIDSQSLLDFYSMQLSIYRVYLYMAFVYRRLVLCSNNDAKSNHGIQNEKKTTTTCDHFVDSHCDLTNIDVYKHIEQFLF